MLLCTNYVEFPVLALLTHLPRWVLFHSEVIWQPSAFYCMLKWVKCNEKVTFIITLVVLGVCSLYTCTLLLLLGLCRLLFIVLPLDMLAHTCTSTQKTRSNKWQSCQPSNFQACNYNDGTTVFALHFSISLHSALLQTKTTRRVSNAYFSDSQVVILTVKRATGTFSLVGW